MKYLSWILTVPLAIVAIVFAITNRAGATLNLWPFGITLEAPLFILVLGSALFGLIAGGLIAWLSAGSTRRHRREAAHRAEAAERELAYLRQKIERERERGAVSGSAANDSGRSTQSGRSRLPATRA